MDTIKEECPKCGGLFLLERRQADANVFAKFPVFEMARIGATQYEIYGGRCEHCEYNALRVVDVVDGIVHYPDRRVGYLNAASRTIEVPPPNFPPD